MSYVDKTLIEGEVVRARAHIHWFLYFWPFLALAFGIVGTILTLPFLPVAIFFGLIALYGLIRWIQAYTLASTTELAVTNFRLIAKWGFIQRETIEQILLRIDSIEVEQTLLGRILGYGSVTVTGTGVTATPLKMIADPLGFRRAVHSAIENHPAQGSSLPQAKGA